MARGASLIAICLAIATCQAARLEPVEGLQRRALLGPINDAIGNITGGIIKPNFVMQNGSAKAGVDIKGPFGVVQYTGATTLGLFNGTAFAGNTHSLSTSILPNQTTIFSELRGIAVGNGVGGGQITGGNDVFTVKNGNVTLGPGNTINIQQGPNTSYSNIWGVRGSGQISNNAPNPIGVQIFTPSSLNLTTGALIPKTFGTTQQQYNGPFGR